MKSVKNLKSFWRSSQNYFVLALCQISILSPKKQTSCPLRGLGPNKKFSGAPSTSGQFPPPPLSAALHSGVTHILYHFCDTSLTTACAIFCSLKFHVVCTCTFFGDTICLLTNRKMIKIVILIDLNIVLT
jgi:hypothetical protein